MAKYKVGDRLRIVADRETLLSRCIDPDEWLGRDVTVESIKRTEWSSPPYRSIGYTFDHGFALPECDFELVEPATPPVSGGSPEAALGDADAPYPSFGDELADATPKSLGAQMLDGWDSPEGQAAIKSCLDAGIPRAQVDVLVKYGRAYPGLAEMRLPDDDPVPPEAGEAITRAVLGTDAARELAAPLTPDDVARRMWSGGRPPTDAEIDAMSASQAMSDSLDEMGDDEAEGVLARVLGERDHLSLARVLGRMHRPMVDRAVSLLTGGVVPEELQTYAKHRAGCCPGIGKCPWCGKGVAK